MSNERNAFDAPTLLSNTHFPAMRVDSDEVLARGRRRVQRRRGQVLAAAVAALLVLVPGGWLVARSIDRAAPVPAGKEQQLTTGLFARSNGVGNLGNGKVRLRAATGQGIDFKSPPSTYQVTRTASGLRVALIKGDVTVRLPQTGGGSSGLFQSSNGHLGVVAAEVPSDTVQATLLTVENDESGTSTPVASHLADGTSVVLIETSKRLTHTASAVIWRRANGTIGSTTGERPAVLTMDHDTFYYFSGLGAFGIDGSSGSDLIRARGLAVGTSVDGSKPQLDFVIAGLYPRGVAKVHLVPAIPGAAFRVAHLPGTSWDLVTAHYRATTKAATPSVVSNFGIWNPRTGEPPAAAPRN